MFQEKYFSMCLIAWEDLQFLFGLTISLECLANIIIDVIVVVVVVVVAYKIINIMIKIFITAGKCENFAKWCYWWKDTGLFQMKLNS